MKQLTTTLLACALLTSAATMAQEAVIRKNLAERLPQLEKIEEVSKTPMDGLYEIRVNGADIYYTDAQGNFLVQGNLIDTKQRRNNLLSPTLRQYSRLCSTLASSATSPSPRFSPWPASGCTLCAASPASAQA